MKARRISILSALVLLAGGAFATSPLFAAGPDGPRPTDEARARESSSRAVILDGVKFAPGELKHTGKPLTWVVTREGLENGAVHAFTSREVAGEFMRRVFKKEFGMDQTQAVTSSSFVCLPGYPSYYRWEEDFTVFNKDVGCGGSDSLPMHSGMQYLNLDFDGWNNRISCVKAACIPAWTVIYACRFFDMTWDSNCEDPGEKFIQPGLIVYDLNSLNFNNRTSSARFCDTANCS